MQMGVDHIGDVGTAQAQRCKSVVDGVVGSHNRPEQFGQLGAAPSAVWVLDVAAVDSRVDQHPASGVGDDEVADDRDVDANSVTESRGQHTSLVAAGLAQPEWI